MAKIVQNTGGRARSRGIIIGKFMPPHRGHQYLVDFANNYVDDLTVLVCSLKSEPIPGEMRFEWMKEMFPGVNMIHVTDENPQEPGENPDFWNIWKETIMKAVPEGADYIFASEDYGWKLGETLGMEYIPVNHARNLVPISGTKVRESPMKYWEYIPESVRPHYVKRVCIFGPESTGKTTLTKNLAAHFNTIYCEEYARGLLEFKDGKVDYEDITRIALGHAASEEALARQANRVLFSDTDLIITKLWSNILFEKCPEWIEEMILTRHYDMYILTDVDVPWIEDNQRYFPEQEKRKWFFDLCVEALEKYHRPYEIISGGWDERLQKAISVVDNLLK